MRDNATKFSISPVSNALDDIVNAAGAANVFFARLYQQGSSAANTPAIIPGGLDGGIGTPMVNAATGNATVTGGGAGVWETVGRFSGNGAAYLIDKSDGGTALTMLSNFTGTLVVAGRFLVSVNFAAGVTETLIDSGYGNGTTGGFGLELFQTASGTRQWIQLRYRAVGAGIAETLFANDITARLGQWVSYVLFFNAVTGVITFFISGAPAGANTMTAPYPTGINTAFGFAIGAKVANGSVSQIIGTVAGNTSINCQLIVKYPRDLTADYARIALDWHLEVGEIPMSLTR